jgi:hypothetical protein
MRVIVIPFLIRFEDASETGQCNGLTCARIAPASTNPTATKTRSRFRMGDSLAKRRHDSTNP